MWYVRMQAAATSQPESTGLALHYAMALMKPRFEFCALEDPRSFPSKFQPTPLHVPIRRLPLLKIFSSIKAASATLAVIAVAAGKALAETHTVTFANNPRSSAKVASFSPPAARTPPTARSSVPSPTSRPLPGFGFQHRHFLDPPHAFSVTTGFGYLGACSPAGADCNNANCNTAFHQPSDTFVQVACQQDNANLVIAFCL
ncbi:Glycopeptide [Mycena sanguinolenta]|uniref:Glycopeptide n=1 Tax=Mycena sanguinolenta TaxID=230812 RepID=A0A8H6Y345_9AGAR|nr:Glycopeptide [Mycena sanguinolenta]